MHDDTTTKASIFLRAGGRGLPYFMCGLLASPSLAFYLRAHFARPHSTTGPIDMHTTTSSPQTLAPLTVAVQIAWAAPNMDAKDLRKSAIYWINT